MTTLKDLIKHPENLTEEQWDDFFKLIDTVHDFGESIQGYNVEIKLENTPSYISKRFYEEHVTMSAVLDSFHDKNEISFKELNEHVFNYIPKEFLEDIPVNFFHGIILKMIRLGFIIPTKTENLYLPIFKITKTGINALQQQTFQNLAVSSFYNFHTYKINKRSILMNLLMLIVTVASVAVTILALTSNC